MLLLLLFFFSWRPYFQLECSRCFSLTPVRDARADWGPLIVLHLWWHLTRIRNAVWNEIKFMHPLNTLAQLKCFFMNQQYHVAKRTKGLSDFVWLCLLYTPLKPNPALSHSPISVVRHSSSVKALKIYVPDFFFTFLPLKGTVSYLPTLQYHSRCVMPCFSPVIHPHPIFDSALILFFFWTII